MAGSSQRQRGSFTAEEVAVICAFDDNDPRSDEDSETGGISSGEEFELDKQLQGENDSDSDSRWVRS